VALCPQCGTPGSGRFCANCGAALPDTAETTPPPAAPQPLSAPGLQENVAAALCYVAGLVTGIIFLVLAPYNQNRTIRFHAWQSILTHAAILIVFLVILPLLPWTLAAAIAPLLGFGAFILWLVLMWKAYNNQRLVLRVIGEFAEKQA
jgi:uncharacterized membrane protein